MSLIVTEPGIYAGITDATYHSDSEALSSSGARTVLACPAQFRWDLTHRTEKPAYDWGHAIHARLLGIGSDIVVVDAPDWRTKAARDERDAAYAEGKTPILLAESAAIDVAVQSVRDDQIAGPLFEAGTPELSGWWVDPDTGEWLRARWDWLTEGPDGRIWIVDFKSTADPAPMEFARSSRKFGYHCQDAWYRDAARALGVDDDPAFVLVAVGKTPPHIVTVHQHDPELVALGAQRNRDAIDLWHACRVADEWPAYGSVVHTIEAPRWAR